MPRLVVIMIVVGLGLSASPAAAQAPEDKALGRAATASSVQGGQTECSPSAACLLPSMANDGRADTRWSSDNRGDEWWQVDLGAPRLVDTVVATWEWAHPRRYRLSTSLDGEEFKSAAVQQIDVSLAELLALAAAPRDNRRLQPRTTTFDPRVARYVRISAADRATVLGLSLWDVGVFGPVDAASPPPPPPPPTPPPSPPPAPPPPRVDPPVDPPPSSGSAEPLRSLRPAPVVRIKGALTNRGVVVELFTVRAPRDARVRIRCRGDACPKRLRDPGLELRRYRRLERELPAGTVIKALITKPGTYGKYTRLTIRRGRPPARTERCLLPGTSRPVPCPAG